LRTLISGTPYKRAFLNPAKLALQGVTPAAVLAHTFLISESGNGDGLTFEEYTAQYRSINQGF